MEAEKLYAVRLLWIRDPEMFAEYQEQTKPIIANQAGTPTVLIEQDYSSLLDCCIA